MYKFSSTLYPNYGIMEDLLFDLDDDGLAVNSDIHEMFILRNMDLINA